MNLKEFAKMLDGREYGYPQFTKEEINIAKKNGFVIIYNSSDDVIEVDGAISYEADLYYGGAVSLSVGHSIINILVNWCEDKDENGNKITWTYDFKIPHENFMIYKNGEPYCRAAVFSIKELTKEYTIEITETFKKRFVVPAMSEAEAIETVKYIYDSRQMDFDATDIVSVEVNAIKDKGAVQ